MKKIGIVLLTLWFGGITMGASECNIGGKPRNESCSITARDTEKIYMSCTDEKGNVRRDDTRAPSDLYPNCQVNTYWPGCKGK